MNLKSMNIDIPIQTAIEIWQSKYWTMRVDILVAIWKVLTDWKLVGPGFGNQTKHKCMQYVSFLIDSWREVY